MYKRQWWRSVENSFNGFVVESFIDELAAAAGQDPLVFRKSLLHAVPGRKPVSEDAPEPERLLAVLKLAAEKANWTKPLTKPRGRGIATYASFGSYFAEVAEVSIVDGKTFKVNRIVAAVDCGRAINPESVRSQTVSYTHLWYRAVVAGGGDEESAAPFKPFLLRPYDDVKFHAKVPLQDWSWLNVAPYGVVSLTYSKLDEEKPATKKITFRLRRTSE